jgi:hypothetical protein
MVDMPLLRKTAEEAGRTQKSLKAFAARNFDSPPSASFRPSPPGMSDY